MHPNIELRISKIPLCLKLFGHFKTSLNPPNGANTIWVLKIARYVWIIIKDNSDRETYFCKFFSIFAGSHLVANVMDNGIKKIKF